MKVYISVDMEGIAGVATLDQVARGGTGYPRAQQLMTAETNAAIAGAFDGGATSVLVNDSHGTMDNLIHADLDPRARLVFGKPKLDCMAEGVSDEHDLAFFIGYHAPAGAPGVLAHTFSSHFLEVRLNGYRASEMDINGLQLAALGVPLGLVTGDDQVCRIAQGFPEVGTVVVKEAHGWSSADSLSPTIACTRIRDAAAEAVRGTGSLKPFPMPPELVLEIDMPNPTAAELASFVPGVERVGNLTVKRSLENPGEVVGLIVVMYQLAASSVADRQAIVQRT